METEPGGAVSDLSSRTLAGLFPDFFLSFASRILFRTSSRLLLVSDAAGLAAGFVMLPCLFFATALNRGEFADATGFPGCAPCPGCWAAAAACCFRSSILRFIFSSIACFVAAAGDGSAISGIAPASLTSDSVSATVQKTKPAAVKTTNLGVSPQICKKLGLTEPRYRIIEVEGYAFLLR
jgi:hypothetical protein